ALGDQRQDLELSGAQCVRRRCPQLAQQPRRDGRRKHGFAPERRSHGADERLARRVLEEVARRAGRDRGSDVAVGVEGREDEDPGRVADLGQLADRAGTVDLGHPEVHEDDVRPEPLGGGHRLAAIGRLADDLELRVAVEDAAEAVADDRVIVDDEQADRWHWRGQGAWTPIAGTRADTAVPPPRSDSIASVPATRLIRWRIAVNPNPSLDRARPSETSNPTPSSRTSRVTTSPMNDSVTPTLVAFAWRATFCSASWAVRRSADSISGWRTTASPVAVTSTGTSLIADQLRATDASASRRLDDSSASGRAASSERRASTRLLRARRAAFSMWRWCCSGRSAAACAASRWVTT